MGLLHDSKKFVIYICRYISRVWLHDKIITILDMENKNLHLQPAPPEIEHAHITLGTL